MSSDSFSGRPRPFTATGERVRVAPPSEDDVPAYADAVTRSAARLSDFAVPDPHNLPGMIANQSPVYRTFMIWALEPGESHGLVGRVNVSNVVGGAFQSATIGYDAYDPYAGRGLFGEGLALVVGLAFADPPAGLGLHRLEANIQPANTRSAGVVRSLGFAHEGFSRDFLYLPGLDGRRDWRDHDRYTILATDWPAVPYHAHAPKRMACVVNGVRAWDPNGLAEHLSHELGLPLYSASTVGDTSTLFELLRASPIGGVVECKASPTELRIGLARARFDPTVVPVLPAASDVDRREVARLALTVRAAYA
ncbi:acetyltransferase [Intrasporangium oryzae NRRL B-24470]|uniref:Acetyltransferase n=1 Tax=Intrasporangium oryzae NRRL B-24470 TaxID=1386089 RepID=W9G5W1_9MICO|nr:GNAT family protein [Intrasporangium oryzae]EWT01521.1 acetyltransferase [Intrasporangium oryzae NRRL B-24470]